MFKKTCALCLILIAFLFLVSCSPKLQSDPSSLKGFNSEIAAKDNINSTQNNISKKTASKDTNSKSNTDSNNVNKQTTANSDIDKIPRTKVKGSIPVLMYHSIDFEKDNTLRTPAKKLDQQMKYLKDNGFYTLSMDETYDYFCKGKAIPEKSVVLTFDDGYLDNYTNLYPILKKYKFKGTIFVITGAVDTEKDFLTSTQIKELDKNCLDIQSHTFAHENLSKLSYDKQVKTLKVSKNFLEKQLNKKINYLAYPYGKYNEDTIKAAKEAGYSMAFTTHGKWANKSNGILTLNRVSISSSYSMHDFIQRVNNPNY